MLIFLLDGRALLGPQHDLVSAYLGPHHKSALVRHRIVMKGLAKVGIVLDPAFRAVLRIQVLIKLMVAVQVAAMVVLVSVLLDLFSARIECICAVISLG